MLADSALIRQAGLIDNPVLNTDQNVLGNNRFFRSGRNIEGAGGSQYFLQIEQLLSLGGKRHNNVRLSEYAEFF